MRLQSFYMLIPSCLGHQVAITSSNGPGATVTELSHLRFISNALKYRTVWSKLSPSLGACECIYTCVPRITLELPWLLHQGTWTVYMGAEPPVVVTTLFFIYRKIPLIVAKPRHLCHVTPRAVSSSPYLMMWLVHRQNVWRLAETEEWRDLE